MNGMGGQAEPSATVLLGSGGRDSMRWSGESPVVAEG